MTSTIRLPIRSLPARFDRGRMDRVLDEIEHALHDEAGITARACADSMTVTLEVPTNQLLEAATTLRALQLL